MRKINVVSTVGDKLKTISTEATDWETLKKELHGQGYDLSGMKSVIANRETKE